MPSWLRSVLMCLLVVALPVQGWAAVTMMSCGPGPHHVTAAAELAAPPVHTHADSHAHPTIGLDAQGSAVYNADTVSDHADEHADGTPCSGHGAAHKLSKSKCSACASCCMGTALPSTVLSFDAHVTRDTAVSTMPQAVVVFLTSGLERPPRSFLA